MEKEKLKLSDVIALAKAGYTPKDVKEIMSLAQSQESPIVETQPATVSESVSQSTTDVTQDNVEASMPKESEPPLTEPDYKALYEAEKEKVVTLQNKNNTMDVSAQNEVTEEHLIDIVKSFC